ncbi:hypothetical protein Aperf_G00000004992 [Anoplocephala perfoliata]
MAVEGDTRGATTQNRCGAVKHNDVIGKPYGSRITTSIGRVVILALDPVIWSISLPHRTQIIYPPDASMIVGQLDLVPGSRVLEAGTGSGALTHALAQAVWPNGRVSTFDFHEERVKRAREEFEEHGLKDVVSVDHRDVLAEGFPEAGSLPNPDGCQAVMIDLPEPWLVVSSIAKCFTPSGGRLCVFSPCIEQVQKTCDNLRSAGFSNIEVLECVSRNYDFVHSILSVPNFGQKNATALYSGTYIYGKPQTTETAEGDRLDEKKLPRKAEPHLFPPLSNYITPSNVSKTKSGNRSDGYWAAVPRHKDTGHTGYLTFASYIPMRRIATATSSCTNFASTADNQIDTTECKESQ